MDLKRFGLFRFQNKSVSKKSEISTQSCTSKPSSLPQSFRGPEWDDLLSDYIFTSLHLMKLFSKITARALSFLFQEYLGHSNLSIIMQSTYSITSIDKYLGLDRWQWWYHPTPPRPANTAQSHSRKWFPQLVQSSVMPLQEVASQATDGSYLCLPLLG